MIEAKTKAMCLQAKEHGGVPAAARSQEKGWRQPRTSCHMQVIAGHGDSRVRGLVGARGGLKGVSRMGRGSQW